MKQSISFIVGVVLGATLAGLVLTKVGQENNDTLNIYKEYYKNTECLLDTLELKYEWVDSYDPQYYYEAVKPLIAD